MPRIDHRLALVWRTPHTVQLGFPESCVRLELNPAQETLLSVLRAGTNVSTLHAIGAMNGMPAPQVEDFLAELAPALEPTRAQRLRVAIDGTGPISEWIALVLRDQSEVRAMAPGDLTRAWWPDLVILVANYAVSPGRAVAWLRREIPHLAVSVGDRSVAVSNLVRVGETPCLVCALLNATDGDDSHTAMLAQLAGRPAGALDRRTGFEVAVRVSRLIEGFDTALRAYSTSEQHEQVLDVVTGAWSLALPQHSPRCSCRALPEIGTAPAGVRAIHSVSPTTGRASAPHA